MSEEAQGAGESPCVKEEGKAVRGQSETAREGDTGRWRVAPKQDYSANFD